MITFAKATAESNLDSTTERAARVILEKVSVRYDVAGAILFGSRARQTHRADSDADIAVLLRGLRGKRADAVVGMAGVAFDVLLDTGVLVQGLMGRGAGPPRVIR